MSIDITTLKATNDYKIVKYEKTDLKKTDSGIIVSALKDVVQDRPTSGIVISEGPKSKINLLNKKVYFENIRGQDLEIQDEKFGYLVIREETILGYDE